MAKVTTGDPSGPLLDRFGRAVDYLRVAITERCNLRCLYCMPLPCSASDPKPTLLRFEEIWRLARAARRLGFVKFRVTGGEPLVVRDVETFVSGLREAVGQAKLCMTTNGVLLPGRADGLRKAGVERLNLSLDTLDRGRFMTLCGRDALPEVLSGLDEALAAGFERVRVNAVIVPGVNEQDVVPLVRLMYSKALDVRFIERMPLSQKRQASFLGANVILKRIQDEIPLVRVAPDDRRATAQQLFGAPGLKGTVGLIAPRSQKFCSHCNRLRLLPSGELRGCLLGKGSLPLADVLRSGGSEAALQAALARAVAEKPNTYDAAAMGIGGAMAAVGG